MRSFQLITACLILLFHTQVNAANSVMVPDDYFQVALPYELQPGQDKTAVLQEKSAQAMQILLMRLTGQKRLVDSGLGQKYISQAQAWLANYNITPRYEDGVAVGQNIKLNFDKNRLQAAFEKQNINLWSPSVRPKTLVMGVFIQSGQLQKLTDEVLDYRIDVDYRNQLDQYALPYLLPQEMKNWVFPVEPTKNRGIIQEQLLANQAENLLSFKLTAKNSVAEQNSRIYELEWFVFNLSGVTLKREVLQGSDRRQLMDDMFVAVMQLYVKQNATQIVRKNHLLLSLSEILSGEQINQLIAEIQAQQPLVKQAQLYSLSKQEAVIDIEYQGDARRLISWLQSWSRISLLSKQGEAAYQAIANPFNKAQLQPQSAADSEAQ